MSDAAELTDGLVVTIDGPAFSADAPEGWFLPDDIVELHMPLAERLAHVTAVEGSLRAAQKSITVKLEIPDFLPEDIENWKGSVGRIELRVDSRSWKGQVTEAHAARVPSINEVYARRRIQWNREKARGARTLAKALSRPYLGGDLGERDRRLAWALIHFAPGELLANYCIIWGLTRGVAFEGGLWFGQQEDHCRPKEDCDHKPSSCSGIWRDVADLFPKGDVEDRRAHVVERLRRLQITEAPGPWGNKDKIYTLEDLSEAQLRSDSEEFSLALEAFLYAHKRAQDLTSDVETCEGEGLATEGRGTEEIPRAADAATAPRALREEFAGASLGDLVQALVPEVPDAAIKRLEELIREAQESPPEDKAGFVAQFNRLMTAQSLRLQVEGEEGLARLTVKEGLIRLAVASRGQQRFRGREIRVVRVPEDYGLKSRSAATSPSPDVS